jgi:hypothetical protein
MEADGKHKEMKRMLQRHGLWEGDEIDSGTRCVRALCHDAQLTAAPTMAARPLITPGRNVSEAYAIRTKL